jgi:DNA-binding transcriptional LysR family regulator
VVNNIGLKYFVGVVRAGSIRRAAEHMHVAASAISRQILMLEEEFGTQFFERHRGQKTLKLTPAGEVVLEYARFIENQLDQVRADIRSIDSLQRGTVRLGVSESFTREFIPEFLKRFHAQYPGITFQVIVSNGAKLVELLAEDQIDVALAYRVPDVFDVTIVAQCLTTPSLLVSTEHPFADRRSVDISECAGLEVAFPDETMTIRESYVRMFAKARIRPKAILVTNSFELMRSAAMAGLCNSIVNKYFGSYKVPPGLRYVPIVGEGVERWSVSLCVHTGRSLPVAAKLFVEQLQAAMTDVVDEDLETGEARPG